VTLGKRLALWSLVLGPVVVVLAISLPPALAQRSGDDLGAVEDVYELIRERYREATDPEELRDAAINGMLEYLDDPYTAFIPAADLVTFDKDVRGEYVGIGAEVDASEGFLRIASPMDGSPAWNAGLEPDDLIVGVDGVSTYMMGLTDIIDRLLGEADTQVMVTVERAGDRTDWPDGAREPSDLERRELEDGEMAPEDPGTKSGRTRFDLTIVRKPIRTVTVKGLFRDGEDWKYYADPEDRVAYVRLTQFTDSTPFTLQSTLESLEDRGMRGLILDLRYNAGGSLLAAIQTADLFLEEGVIVSTKGRGRASGVARAADQRDDMPDFPMVVLVNAGSASASEIVAGALKDNDRAKVLGERTFGKGSVQGVYPLRSGDGSLKITEQYYYLPSGRLLHRTDDSTEWGVDPSAGFYIPMEPEASIEMWRERRDAETLRSAPPEGDWSDPAWILDHLKDPQLAGALDAINAKVRTGAWSEPGVDAPEGTIELAELRLEEERLELFLDEVARLEQRIAVLRQAAATDREVDEDDLIPGDPALADGRLEVYDAQGKVVATLRITGEGLERFLIRAPVEQADMSAGADDEAGAPGEGDG
jgi:carboxyl-terminal processing protease